MSAVTPLTQMGEVKLVRPPDPPGQLAVLLTVIDGEIVMDLGRAVWWVKFSPDQTEKLANEMLAAVRSARTLHVPPGEDA